MRSPSARGCARNRARSAEALADLREADAIYARLKLDFNRIDTSSALALALLAAGDVPGANDAADTAIGIETRIRVNSANPELRARFLSASYAPYEARIEVDLAAGSPADDAAEWKAFRVAEAIRARSLSDRLAHAARHRCGCARRERRSAARADDRTAGGSRASHPQGQSRRRRGARNPSPHRRSACAARGPHARPARRRA